MRARGTGIGKLLAAACQRHGNWLALVRGNETRMCGELAERGARVANALCGAALAPGATGYEGLVSQVRSALSIEPRVAGDLAISGWTRTRWRRYGLILSYRLT